MKFVIDVKKEKPVRLAYEDCSAGDVILAIDKHNNKAFIMICRDQKKENNKAVIISCNNYFYIGYIWEDVKEIVFNDHVRFPTLVKVDTELHVSTTYNL